MIWFILIAGLVAVVVEAIYDRKGEDRRGKFRDAIGLTIAASLICLIACWLGDVNPLKTLALILGVRVLTFDYLASYLLIKNGVIVGKWWSYSGQTAKWDRLTGRVHWGIRLALRLILFALSVTWFLL